MDRSSHDDLSFGAAGLSRRAALRGLGVGGLAAAATAGAGRALAALPRSEAPATPGAGSTGPCGRLVYHFAAKFTDLVPIGLVPEGIRLDAPFAGSIGEGPFAGGSVSGTTYGLIRADGVEVIDVRGYFTTPADQRVSVRVSGYVIPPAGAKFPPLEDLLRPGFAWPDVDQPVHGFALYETGAADLAWLNRTALAIEGTANAGARTLLIAAYAFVTVPELRAA